MHAAVFGRITSEDLLWSTASSAQCQAAAWAGRGFEGEGRDTCMCTRDVLCCPPETITTLLTGYQFSSVQSLYSNIK